MILWSGEVRVYFNAYDEAPLFWSVDNGEPKSEIKTHKVVFDGVYGGTWEHPDGRTQPRAWIYLPRAKVCLEDDNSIRLVK